MEITNYLPFRCIIFVSDSTLIVGVRIEMMIYFKLLINIIF
jgi:hypothetical protein